jgi:isopenicillin-N epimerase
MNLQRIQNEPKFGRAIRDQFLLEDGIAFLNNGSYGAPPRVVYEAAEAFRRRCELQPIRFMQQELPGLLRESADALGRFLHIPSGELALVDNATSGVNAVLRDMMFAAGDELLTTNHVYNAVRQTMRHVASRCGATVVEADVPFPTKGDDEIVAAILARVSVRTKLLVVDHITSPTALIFPVARLAAEMRKRNIPILIDGAHAPGMIALDVPAIGADWYAGNCHKWLFAPKGCAFVWAAPAHRVQLHPTVISHGYGAGLAAEFDWVGTRDYSPWAALPTAIGFYESLGAELVRARNHALAVEAGQMLAATWRTEIGGPPALLGNMATIRLPVQPPPTVDNAKAIRRRLWDRHSVEAPIFAFGGQLWLRIAAQVFNEMDDYRRLAAVDFTALA